MASDTEASRRSAGNRVSATSTVGSKGIPVFGLLGDGKLWDKVVSEWSSGGSGHSCRGQCRALREQIRAQMCGSTGTGLNDVGLASSKLPDNLV